MKMLTILAVLLACTSCAAAASQEPPHLGDYHVYFEYSAMMMQHVTFDTDDAGIHIGLAGYKHLGRDWYLGVELGAGGSLTMLTDSSDITMVELNAKRVFALGDAFRFDLGGGFSYNNVHFDDSGLFDWDDDGEIDDSVLGAQALANAHLKLGWFILGAHLKYMLTGDVEGVQEVEELEKGWDYSNLTAGVHAGFLIN
ncbi:MAG TPA: outer membrane beta-barrel protein [Candidatus Krumholzibacteria bacterium]|nr:outer membrane beta-barrel protein [Candidatus Krumholzibacteria bacterium]HPD73171.1 outer membrane beta-barrel protein [Candidatus Krumholzibacteria bacterium]HRY41951.1 outer membrane beta-barrel protein [Candidatus Krumholzibacteria bacterium]